MEQQEEWNKVDTEKKEEPKVEFQVLTRQWRNLKSLEPKFSMIVEIIY